MDNSPSPSAGQSSTNAVLFVHSADEGYGADRILLEMVKGCRTNGRSAWVLIPDDTPTGWLSAQLKELGVPVFKGTLAPARRKYLRPKALLSYVRDLFRGRRFVRRMAAECRAGIIHVNTSAMLVGVVIGRPLGCRVIWHVHEIVIKPAWVSWIFKRAPFTADRVVVVSDAVHRHLRPKRESRKLVRIHNGIEPRAQGESAAADIEWMGSPVIAYIGRLSHWKGYRLFVEAIAQLAGDFPEVGFIVAGSPAAGEEWRIGELEDLIAGHGLADRVGRLGFYPDSRALLNSVDIVVVPSTWPDPFPTVILEAMRAGRAVVAANHGGAPEMIEHEQSGLLFESGDPRALASALHGLLLNSEVRLTLGLAARKRFEALFQVSRFQNDIEALYRKLESGTKP